MDKVIGIGEYYISSNKKEVLKTYALSSCVALTAYNPKDKVGGMIHMALPSVLPGSDFKPGYTVTEGVPRFLYDMVVNYGCDLKDLVIGIYGGASAEGEDYFRIGERNLEAALNILSKFGLRIAYNETRGRLSRTLSLDIKTGKITIITQPLILSY